MKNLKGLFDRRCGISDFSHMFTILNHFRKDTRFSPLLSISPLNLISVNLDQNGFICYDKLQFYVFIIKNYPFSGLLHTALPTRRLCRNRGNDRKCYAEPCAELVS